LERLARAKVTVIKRLLGLRAHLAPTKGEGYTVNLPGAGSYTISYADGPKKGQVIKQVTVQKAGPVKVSAIAFSE